MFKSHRVTVDHSTHLAHCRICDHSLPMSEVRISSCLGVMTEREANELSQLRKVLVSS